MDLVVQARNCFVVAGSMVSFVSHNVHRIRKVMPGLMHGRGTKSIHAAWPDDKENNTQQQRDHVHGPRVCTLPCRGRLVLK